MKHEEENTMAQTAVAAVEPTAEVAPAATHTDASIPLLDRMMMTPDVPMERVHALMDLQERQMNKVAEQRYNAAFASAMAEMPPAKRSGLNNHTKQRYSTLNDLVAASRPVLSAHGLALNWRTSMSDGWMTVTAIIRHKDGWREENSKSAPMDAGKGSGASMNTIQAHGSTETYLKRYTGFGILGLSSDDETDDDGNGATATITAEQFRSLRDLMDKANASEGLVLRIVEAPSLEELPQSQFGVIVNMLRQRISAQKGNANA